MPSSNWKISKCLAVARKTENSKNMRKAVRKEMNWSKNFGYFAQEQRVFSSKNIHIAHKIKSNKNFKKNFLRADQEVK